MGQTTLKYLRVLIPGLIILIGLLPIKNQLIGFGVNLDGLDYNYTILFAITLGAIYYQLNIQHFITSLSHYLIVKNIYNRLLKTYSKDIDNKIKKYIWDNESYMRVFYNIIDNDESLKQKANLVRFNGIFWTSSADIFIISLIYMCLYHFNLLVTSNNAGVTKALVIIMFSALFLHVISVRKHIKLSNDQLKVVDDLHKSQVESKIDDLIKKIQSNI
jgi:GH18 family chitinase